jgi:UDP-N-acetylmuramoylalanine--D-glutamate ligase
MSLRGKKIAILGVGRSGRAAAALAVREGAEVSAWDSAGSAAFSGLPESVEIHPHATEAEGAQLVSDILVVSPGIDTFGSYVRAFSKHAGEVIGEVELAARYHAGRIIGITGTNGKTTTTELVERILAHAGLGGTACGNYGVPFAEVVLQTPAPAVVALELSSFQLETVRSLHCDVAVWLNFAPDHMDRYPTVEAYRAAKLRIFETQTADDVAVIRQGEGIFELAAKAQYFSTTDPSATWYSAGRVIEHQGESWLDMEAETGLRGLHNAENLMAAMAACHALGISRAAMREALRGYTAPRHRCELVRVLDGVEYLNDSKATNLHALESALRSQTRPLVLIAGGKEKGLDYSAVLPLLAERALAAVTFGEIARPLAGLFSSVIPCESVSSLADAVAIARSHAPSGSTILLSPGTSSFDQFTGYEQRGNAFCDLVHQLC